MRWLALFGVTLALLAAGCGGGDEEVVTSFGDVPTGHYCGTLLTARVFIEAAFLGSGKVSQEALDELVRNTPTEIREDVRILSQALATLEEKDVDFSDPFELEAALEALDPEMSEAEKHLDAWQKTNCK